MISLKKRSSILSSNVFLFLTSGISVALFLSNYYQHRKTTKKIESNYKSERVSASSFGNLLFLISKKNNQNSLESSLDSDSLYFLQDPQNPDSINKFDHLSVPPKNTQSPKNALSKPKTPLEPVSSQKILANSKKIINFDKRFLFRIKALLRILIPSWRSKEMLIICLHSLFLVLRTWISVLIAELDGNIVKYLIQADGKRFFGELITWFVLSIPATYTNSMVRYLESKLSIAFRTRLFTYANDLYLNDKNPYYKISNLDNRIKNPDQYLTADITRFCSSLSHLFSSVGKPIIDIVAFNIQLTRNLGAYGSVAMFVFYSISVFLLRKITPPFGKFVALQALLEGQYRSDHSRIVSNSEEIAFYKGQKVEKKSVTLSLSKLLDFSLLTIKKRFSYVIAEDIIVKYIWSTLGYILGASPYFLNINSSSLGSSSAVRMQKFVTNKRVMVNIADAGGRLMYSARKAMELSGHTERIFSFLQTCHALRLNYYPELSDRSSNSFSFNTELTLAGAKRISYDDFYGIKLACVPIVAPNPNPYLPGNVLVQPLFWRVNPGEHWLIKGPGGVGKTSLLRIISGLWPVFSGVLEKPPDKEIMYVPSRAYLCIGTLRDQIIYPDSHDQMVENGCTDFDLLEILRVVSLEYLPVREGGLDSIKNWKDVLSGGERQRICMARLFYHQPMFAILDDCTSAVSYETEGKIYEYAKSIDITLITISHRNSLSMYHDYVLRLGDSYASSMPSLGVKLGSSSPTSAHETLGFDSTGNNIYAGRAWSGAELVALDESEEMIQATMSEDLAKNIPSAGYGVAWHTARLNTSLSEPQSDSLSNDSADEKGLGESSTEDEDSLVINNSERHEQPLTDQKSTEEAFNKKKEVSRLRRVLLERKKLYQQWEDRLSSINFELNKTVLDQKIVDALK
ncbi:ATP-binding cassette sub-family D member 2 [Smittium mucronatum]|uniref:ATP-binding cassette sub-family D member 2 n=1 Tax=Smittium mucronatum TaxID=133383 RepID=A0A1R0GLU2_9FUNG|nr:ATP-binding cassette sub-family D member 2 [Smittium mucronatum]OLY80264.1 ATP-binding cassette sub-family D member 2 [Smittium mucronatum]